MLPMLSALYFLMVLYIVLYRLCIVCCVYCLVLLSFSSINFITVFYFTIFAHFTLNCTLNTCMLYITKFNEPNLTKGQIFLMANLFYRSDGTMTDLDFY